MAEFDLEKMADRVAEKALDEFTYNGKTIREWVELMVAAESVVEVRMVEELEKIKAEIKQQGSVHVRYRRIEDIDQLVDNIVYQCKDAFCDYIDNHIKELKGENNEKL